MTIGKHNEAIACYDKAIEIDPMYADAWNNKGFSLDELGKYQEAEACYDKALEIDPQDAVAWYNRGQSFKSIGMYKEAIEAFKNFIRFATSKYAGHIEKNKRNY